MPQSEPDPHVIHITTLQRTNTYGVFLEPQISALIKIENASWTSKERRKRTTKTGGHNTVIASSMTNFYQHYVSYQCQPGSKDCFHDSIQDRSKVVAAASLVLVGVGIWTFVQALTPLAHPMQSSSVLSCSVLVHHHHHPLDFSLYPHFTFLSPVLL